MPAATVQATEYEESTTEYVVQLEDAQSVEEVLEENAEAVSEKEESDDLKEEQVLVLNLTPSEAEALENREDVVSIEENIIFQGSSAEVEEPTAKKKAVVGKDMREEQWNLKAIHLPQEREENQEEIKVAVLDSGVSFDKDVPVEGNIAISDVLESENVMFDDASGHGTGIAGMIAAQDNEDRIRGIHPEAKVYSIRVLNENNQATLSQVIAGIYKAIDLDCKILNMSFGTMTDSEALHQAVRSAYDAGMLLIAAGGNTEGASIEYPAAYPEVMAVGATDNTGNKIQTTSDGEELGKEETGDSGTGKSNSDNRTVWRCDDHRRNQYRNCTGQCSSFSAVVKRQYKKCRFYPQSFEEYDTGCSGKWHFRIWTA